MTVQGEVKETTAQITRLIWADGKDGTPQWEVQLRWPWTPPANKGGDKTWVTQADFPQWTAATKGAVNVEVAAGYIKKAAEGKEPFDGHLDWMWHWYIRKVLDHAPSTPIRIVSGSGSSRDSQGPERSIDQRIAWNSAVNNATNLLANSDKDAELEPLQGAIKYWAAWYYDLIVSDPPAADAQDGATLPAEAPAAPEPSRTPAPAPQGQGFDPRKVLRASFDHYNSDAEALGMEPLDMRVVAAKVAFKFGDIAKMSPENAATAAKAVADGSIVTWPTGEKS